MPASGNPLREAVLNSLKVVASLSPTIPQELPLLAANAQDAGEPADLVAAALDLSPEEQQRVLELIDPLPRLQEALRLCEEKARYLEVSQQIQREVGQKAGQQQREYILREQLIAIQRELGELDPQQTEIAELRREVESKVLLEEVNEEVARELSRLESINPASPEYAVIRSRLDWILALPWSDPPPDAITWRRRARSWTPTTTASTG